MQNGFQVLRFDSPYTDYPVSAALQNRIHESVTLGSGLGVMGSIVQFYNHPGNKLFITDHKINVLGLNFPLMGLFALNILLWLYQVE